jgi:NitT/TauT family transport system permease protein
VKRVVIGAAAAAALLVLWQIAAEGDQDIYFFISSPLACLTYAIDHPGALGQSTLVTTCETIAGFLIAAVLSLACMIGCLYWPKGLRTVLPIFVASQIVPLVTLAPIFIVLFGMGLASKIAMVALMCFFPIFINFSAGVTAVPIQVSELLYVYNASSTFKIFGIIIPLSLPHIFVGLQISTTMAVMGAIVAEFMGARDGLGKNLYLAPKSSEPQLMICSITLVFILGFSFYKFISFLERRFCKVTV